MFTAPRLTSDGTLGAGQVTLQGHNETTTADSRER